jgi:hypothetical protein
VRSLNLSPFWRWALALVLALGGLLAQRLLSSELPLSLLVEHEGRQVTTELDRNHLGPGGQRLSVQGVDSAWTGELIWRPAGGEGEFVRTPLRSLGSLMTGEIPAQERGTRVEYRLEIATERGALRLPEHGTVFTRFRGAAPLWVSLSHVILLSLGLLFALRAGLEALALGERALLFAGASLLSFLGGGLILGPLMKHHAYGFLWAGPPRGLDSTDTKTLVVVFAWLLPLLLRARGRRARGWIILAALLSLAAFLIPHSTFGRA